MANNAYLINSELMSGCIETLIEKAEPYDVVATGSNQIPAAWFFCFEAADLQPAEYNYTSDEDEPGVFKFMAPCTTKERALANIIASKHLFVEFCGHEAIAEEYWAKAVSDLQDLKYPYLSMHPLEVFFLNDPDEDAITFNQCFTRTAESFSGIAELSFYDKNLVPYGLVELYANPYLSDRYRCRNSSSLDMGIKGVDTSSWVPMPETPATKETQAPMPLQREKPWWKFW
ncbi:MULTISPECIES: hypothetical protein [Shewanella]|uniref:hypothetical protein n=1 Tax=Shewanella TaxID=22 RepID=UPI001C4F4408|nr:MULTISPECIES: hypothetical protein [Shewanella]MBW0278492.1 hypothetical protein [Shewanella xiamenensis]MCH7422505.1 hypothetical protein [Shewanella sp. MM_2022_3]MCT8871930.1 hypothetical protein [Shewanella xiamenensis]UWH41408.1 hypothetical protein KXJ80_19560 [Shewanella xiamenensis]